MNIGEISNQKATERTIFPRMTQTSEHSEVVMLTVVMNESKNE